MSKWTSGEWEHVDDIGGSRVVADGHGFSAPYRKTPGSGRCEQQVADNKLISAAPNMAEALDKIGAIASANTDTPAGGIMRQILGIAYAALSKAGALETP